MSEKWNIVTSIITSSIVSISTFVIGLKTNKNEADRQIVREKYKNIYTHLNDILKHLNTTTPKKWSNYKKVQTDINSYRYVPLIAEMNANGEGLILDIDLVNRLEKIETQALIWGSKYFNNFDYIEDVLLKCIKEYYKDIIENEYEISTFKDKVGQSYYSVNLGIFIYKEKIENVFKYHDKNIALEIKTNNKSININNNIKDDNISFQNFLLLCNEEIVKNKNIKELLEDRQKLIKDLNMEIENVKQRIKEPFTFWETVIGAFTDIFKR